MPGVAEKTYYDILGVSKDAPQDEIRKAYLKLAKKYHPDKTGGDKAAEEKLKEINNAYQVLKDPDKRKEYDAEQASPFRAGAQSQGFGFESAGFDASSFGSFEDIFGDLFGGRASARRAGPRPGNDMEVPIRVTLDEVLHGATRSIRVPQSVTCHACGGTGAAKGSAPITCPDCNGTGQSARGNNAFFISQTCARCGGSGRIIENPCRACNGSGYTREYRRINVTIPPGVQTGTRLRSAGQGEPGEAGGPRGDLYVAIEVMPHEFFERKGADLICEVPIRFTDAALGAKIRVPTLTGQAELNVPAGTQSGKVFRLRGMGLPTLRGGGKGDELVRVTVEVPVKLSGRQKEILKNLQKLDDPSTHPRRKSFLEKLKRTVGRGKAAAAVLALVAGGLLLAG